MRCAPAVFLACAAALLSVGSSTTEPFDPQSLILEARQIQQRDLAAWGTMSFRRQVVRERLDAADQVTETMLLDFLVVAKGDGRFDELLRRIDGRLASRSEVREHRRAKRFEKRYRTAFVGDATEYEQGDFSLAHFMTRPHYNYGGIEVIDGQRCHRLDFSAEPEGQAHGGIASQLSAGTEGTLWLDVASLQTVRAESRLVRPISAMMGLVKVERVEIEMVTQPVGEHRLPGQIFVTTTSTLGGRRQYKRNRFLYDAHRSSAVVAASGGAS